MDLICLGILAVVLIAVLTAVATGHGVSAEALGATVGRLGLFLSLLLVGGLLLGTLLPDVEVSLATPAGAWVPREIIRKGAIQYRLNAPQITKP